MLVVPLRIGGGTRLKIFEALAAECPVVSTTVGAEGLPLVAGEHLLIADDPDEFAAEVAHVLTDTNRARELAANGAALVRREYSWPAVARAFSDACERVAGRHKPVRSR
jgi:glycosyltransferase involved in cell wall biosynthesis